jgi:hypothetical protein
VGEGKLPQRTNQTEPRARVTLAAQRTALEERHIGFRPGAEVSAFPRWKILRL